MNVLGFDRELDVTLARAAEGVALARDIQISLAGSAAGEVPEGLWRGSK